MKRVAMTTGALALLALAGSAQAIEGGVSVGKDYTDVHVGLGTTTLVLRCPVTGCVAITTAMWKAWAWVITSPLAMFSCPRR